VCHFFLAAFGPFRTNAFNSAVTRALESGRSAKMRFTNARIAANLETRFPSTRIVTDL